MGYDLIGFLFHGHTSTATPSHFISKANESVDVRVDGQFVTPATTLYVRIDVEAVHTPEKVVYNLKRAAHVVNAGQVVREVDVETDGVFRCELRGRTRGLFRLFRIFRVNSRIIVSVLRRVLLVLLQRIIFSGRAVLCGIKHFLARFEVIAPCEEPEHFLLVLLRTGVLTAVVAVEPVVQDGRVVGEDGEGQRSGPFGVGVGINPLTATNELVTSPTYAHILIERQVVRREPHDSTTKWSNLTFVNIITALQYTLPCKVFDREHALLSLDTFHIVVTYFPGRCDVDHPVLVEDGLLGP